MYRSILFLIALVSFVLFLFINIPSPIRIEGDGVFYYSWLRSAVFDRDFDFKNELGHYSEYDYYSKRFIKENKLTPAGKTPNAYAWGAGLMWLPFILIAHLITLISGGAADGFSDFYVWAVNFGSWVYGSLALLLVWRILKKFFGNKISLISSLAVWLATPWVYYQFFEPSMSHMASLFLVSLFLYLIVKSITETRFIASLPMVVIIFLMIATRWQNVVFLVVFLPLIWQNKNKIKKTLILVAPAVIFIFIQMAIWKYLYGIYLLIPQGHQFVGYHFYGLRVLFSSDRGLFLWSPVLILALIGWWKLLKKDKFLGWMVLIVFIGQWLVNASLNDPSGGEAYGARRFIELMPFLVIPLAIFFQKWKKYWLLIWLMIAILIIWNLILIQNYRYNLIPQTGEFRFLNHNYLRIINN